MPIQVVCQYEPCSAPFDTFPCHINNGRGVYCSRRCKGLASRIPATERFWLYVNKTETCWLWTGGIVSGYGRFNAYSSLASPVLAHRYSWEIFYGVIPDGLLVLHNCPEGDNRLCVNPTHLYLGTYHDNNSDTVRKGRRHPNSSKGQPKLTHEERSAIHALQGHQTIHATALQYGVSDSLIWKIWHNKT